MFLPVEPELTGEEMAARFLNNLHSIVDACGHPGPYIYAVHKNRIEKLPIGDR